MKSKKLKALAGKTEQQVDDLESVTLPQLRGLSVLLDHLRRTGKNNHEVLPEIEKLIDTVDEFGALVSDFWHSRPDIMDTVIRIVEEAEAKETAADLCLCALPSDN